jgi:hypothetical protein
LRSTILRLTAPVVVGAAGGDPDDVDVQGAGEVGRDAGDGVDRPVDHRQVEAAAEDRVGALLGGDGRVLQGELGGEDRLDGLVVDRLAPRATIGQREVDREEVEPDRQGIGQGVDGLGKLGSDAVAQEFGDRVGGTHSRSGSEMKFSQAIGECYGMGRRGVKPADGANWGRRGEILARAANDRI